MHILDLGKKVCVSWLPWEGLFQDRDLEVRCAQLKNSSNILQSSDSAMEMKNYGIKKIPFWGNKGGDDKKTMASLEKVG